MAHERASGIGQELISELKRKYIWWEPIGGIAPSQERIIAQAMNLGTFEDIRRLERILGGDRLADVMLRAEPGWLSDRSWEFWRGRLSRGSGRSIPDAPPRRAFHAEAL